MSGIIRRYQKQLLAIFSVLLMVMFLLPLNRGGNGSTRSDTVAGTMGKTKIYAHELSDAQVEWQWLSSVQLPSQDPSNPNPQPLTSILGSAATQIDRDPGTFLLLQKEAGGMGLRVPAEMVDSAMQQIPQATENPDNEAMIRSALAGLLLVREELNTLDGAVKISRPQLQYAMATQQQQIGLKVVEFDASDYVKQVPDPSKQAMTDQYDRYSSDIAGQIDPLNDPLGLGYKYPNRIRFDYISVNHDAVKKMIVASKPDVEWKAAALRYIRQNPDQFPATAPSTAPSTRESKGAEAASPTTAPAVAAGPTKDQILEAYNAVINQAVDAQIAQITGRIGSMLSTDYLAWSSAQSAGAQSNGGAESASTLGVPYNTDEYLRRLAASIQSEFGVLPTVAFISNGWKTEADLAAEPGIGETRMQDSGTPFPSYAIEQAAAFLPDSMKNDPHALAKQQPSLPLTDDAGSTYVFRITDVDPSTPAPFADVQGQVRRDLITANAFAIAGTQADSLSEKCETAAALPAAAKAVHKSVITTGLFQADANTHSIEGLMIKPESVPLVTAAATNLLMIDPQTGTPSAVQTVRLDADRKYLVIALDQVHPLWTDQDEPMMRSAMDYQMRRGLQDQIAAQWCNSHNVIARLNYHPVDADKKPA